MRRLVQVTNRPTSGDCPSTVPGRRLGSPLRIDESFSPFVTEATVGKAPVSQTKPLGVISESWRSRIAKSVPILLALPPSAGTIPTVQRSL
jgi:hypothetical protein